MVRMCSFRQWGCVSREGHCSLYLDDLHEGRVERDRMPERTYSVTVFQTDGDIRDKWGYISRLYCSEEMSQICPFRKHVVREEREPLRLRGVLVDCPRCGKRHFEKSSARLYCEQYTEAKRIFEEMERKGESWSPEGSTEDPFGGGLSAMWAQQFWENIRGMIVKRDNHTCQMCGIKSDGGTIKDIGTDKNGFVIWLEFEVHHIIPRSKGGSHHPKNLVMVCKKCHSKLTAELLRDNAKERRQKASNELLEAKKRQFGKGAKLFKELLEREA